MYNTMVIVPMLTVHVLTITISDALVLRACICTTTRVRYSDRSVRRAFFLFGLPHARSIRLCFLGPVIEERASVATLI